MQPLSGIRVLDFSTLLPGPLAGLILAEAGAEVIKIERPGGEEMRAYHPRWGNVAANYALLNRGKTLLTADLKSDKDLAVIRHEIERADVMLEQFRPGVMKRLGLDYETVREINPKIIYCSITGYGQDGPRASEAGHDLNYIGHTGLLGLSHGTPDSPSIPPALIADIGGGSFPAVMNILMALVARERTGEGAYLDIAMSDAMFTFAFWALASGQAGAGYPGNREGGLAGGSPRYQLYQASCGRFVAVAALEQKFWETFCRIADVPTDLIDDRKDPDATRLAIKAIIASKPVSEWEPIFAEGDCCVSIVKNIEEALRDPHFVERGLFSWKVSNDVGDTGMALPVPVAACFREPAETVKPTANEPKKD